MTKKTVFFSTSSKQEDLGIPGTDGLIYVVDSADRDRIDQAREELKKMLGEQERFWSGLKSTGSFKVVTRKKHKTKNKALDSCFFVAFASDPIHPIVGPWKWIT